MNSDWLKAKILHIIAVNEVGSLHYGDIAHMFDASLRHQAIDVLAHLIAGDHIRSQDGMIFAKWPEPNKAYGPVEYWRGIIERRILERPKIIKI